MAQLEGMWQTVTNQPLSDGYKLGLLSYVATLIMFYKGQSLRDARRNF